MKRKRRQFCSTFSYETAKKSHEREDKRCRFALAAPALSPKIVPREGSPPNVSIFYFYPFFNKPGATVMSFLWVNGTLLCLAFELADSYTTHLAYHIHLTQISHLQRFARGKFSFLFWSCSHLLRPLNSNGRFRWFCIGLENTFPVFSLERSYYTGFAYPT